MLRRLAPLALALAALAPAVAAGTTVKVTIHGTVAFNSITKAPFNLVSSGQAATLSFLLDSDSFVNSSSFPTRGYVIDQSSFALAFPATSVALQSPFPAGQTPYFVIRNNDPAVDGFMVTTDVDGPVGVPLVPSGTFGHFVNAFHVTYLGTTLPSLDLLDALGSYDYTGLTVFNWSVDDGPFNPLGIDFVSMDVEVVAQTWVDKGNALAGVTGNPKFTGTGDLSGGSGNTLTLIRAAPNALCGLVVGLSGLYVPFKGGTLVPALDVGPVLVPSNGAGQIVLPFTMPSGLPAGTGLWMQWAIPDAAAVHGVALSNALLGTTP
jgi:hypothetical protein